MVDLMNVPEIAGFGAGFACIALTAYKLTKAFIIPAAPGVFKWILRIPPPAKKAEEPTPDDTEMLSISRHEEFHNKKFQPILNQLDMIGQRFTLGESQFKSLYSILDITGQQIERISRDVGEIAEQISDLAHTNKDIIRKLDNVETRLPTAKSTV